MKSANDINPILFKSLKMRLSLLEPIIIATKRGTINKKQIDK